MAEKLKPLVEGERDVTAYYALVKDPTSELERSAAFRAYRARHEEGKQYLERQRQT